MVNLKNNILERRRSKNLTQEELAKLVGVTRQTILAIENNKYDPSLRLAMALAKVLGTTVDELFFSE